ncbi:hypothetical protein F5Y10DRAFT_129575 [Nemania abortiva]|nr:hypothetical protein F5Y10DRAFT_129575 [Nemania abortiva]
MCPQGALNGFYWKGRDLHSQRRYLALRLRFRREPYGYLIAHDIHDAVKEFRNRTHQREKTAEKHVKKRNRTDKGPTPQPANMTAVRVSSPMFPHARYQGPAHSKSNPRERISTEGQTAHTNPNRERSPSYPIEEDRLQDIGTGRAKAKNKLTKIFTTISKTSSLPSPSRITMRTASPSRIEDPFQDPTPVSRKLRTKAKKAKRSGKTTASLESVYNAENPSTEPMRLIDEDDFRLKSPLSNTD